MREETIKKVCTKCGEPKELEEFCKDAGYKDGRRSDCNECRAIARSSFRRELEDAVHSAATLTHARLVPGPVSVPYVQTAAPADLPDPAVLPAAYMKRVSDYWVDLIGGEEPATRIA